MLLPFFAKGTIIYVEDDGFDACGWLLIIMSYLLVVITFPIAAFFCINVRLFFP